MFLAATAVQAQIIIGGGVYGGARQADVEGSTFVNIAADNYDILINAVYGGNDIAGTVGTSATLPNEIEDEEAKAPGIDAAKAAAKGDDLMDFVKWFLRILLFAFASGTIVILSSFIDKKRTNKK